MTGVGDSSTIPYIGGSYHVTPVGVALAHFSLKAAGSSAVSFSTADAAVRQLERDGKPSAASALRGLTDRMLRMKTLI